MASSNLPTDLQNLRTVLVTDMKGVMSDLIQDALSPLKKSLDDVKKTTDSHTTKINELETALSEYSDQVTEMTATCTKLQAENQALADRVEDAENRARRCNLRLINIPEKAEGTDAVKFMAEFFAEVLGKEVYPTPPVLERAHRLGQRQENRPRAMIVCFRYYQDKVCALERDRNRLIWCGQKVADCFTWLG